VDRKWTSEKGVWRTKKSRGKPTKICGRPEKRRRSSMIAAVRWSQPSTTNLEHDRGVDHRGSPDGLDLEQLDDDELVRAIDLAYGPAIRDGATDSDAPPVEMSMVTSLDGSVAVAGGSRALSSRVDLAVLLRLRHHACVTLVGAGTVRSEDYAVPTDPTVRFAVVTGQGDLDWESALWRSGHATAVAPESVAIPDHVPVIRAGHNDIDITTVVQRVSERFRSGTAPIHLEGGPKLNAALHDHDLIDAINLTISPTLVAGPSQRALDGPTERLRHFRRRHVLIAGDHLLTRWERDRTC